jgi:hypothetical protein
MKKRKNEIENFALSFVIRRMNVPLRAPAIKASSSLQPAEILGLKFFSRHLTNTLAKLHAHKPDPKRQLFYDQYLCLLLLSFYNPVLNSLRALQAATQVSTVRKALELPYASLGSLSEASHVFDPGLLHQVFRELSAQTVDLKLPKLPAHLPDALRLVATDGTLWETLPRMAKALYQQPLTREHKGGFKGHFQFDILKDAPLDVEFTAGNVGESGVLARHLHPGLLYLLDRGYHSYQLFDEIKKAGSSLLARLRTDSVYSVVAERPLSARDQAAGVYFDATVKLGQHPAPGAAVRRIIKARVISPPPHNLHPRHQRGKHKAYHTSTPLIQEWILVTDRLDLDADVLVLLYQHRWKIELFFRWLKCTLKCAHLFCESENGMKLQFYGGLIAALLVLLYTGCKPNKRILEILQLHFMGWAAWTDVKFYIAKYGKPAKA